MLKNISKRGEYFADESFFCKFRLLKIEKDGNLTTFNYKLSHTLISNHKSSSQITNHSKY